MRLIVAIVQGADSGRLTDALVANGFRSTRVSTMGAFLDEPNVTMLIGIEDDDVETVLKIIRQNCQARRRYINAAPMAVETVGMPVVTAAPLEVEVGGAAVFVLPVRHIVHARQGEPVLPTGLRGGQGMLVLAIVQADDAASVISSLTKAGYRLTRVDTIGGFLKKGNATLLIGVTAEHVDRVLALMQTSCRPRDVPQQARPGLPAYCVTAFVVEMVPMTPTDARS